MKFLSVIFFLNVYFTFQQILKILEKGKILLNEINDNEYYLFKYIISKKDDELIIPINIYLSFKESFNYYIKCTNENSIPTFTNNDERILKDENIDDGIFLYEDFPSINNCEFLYIKIKFVKNNQLTKFNISVPQNNVIIKYRDNYVNFKYEEIDENESKEPFYFVFNQDIANIFFFSKNNLIKVFYGNSNKIFSRKYNQFSYISLYECIRYDSKIIIRLLTNNKITYSYLMSNKYIGFSEYDFSNVNTLTIPFNIPNCDNNELLIFGGFNSIKKVYLITELFIGDFNISYSNIFGNSYAFNYIDFKNINYNYQEFNTEFMIFKIKSNQPTIFNFKLIEPMNISFLKIKNDEYFYNIFDFEIENQKEIQIPSSDIINIKITFYPKSNSDNNTININLKDKNYTLSNKNKYIQLNFESQLVFIIEGKEKSLLSFKSNSFKSYNEIEINNNKTFSLSYEHKLFYINISNIINSIFNFEVIINLNNTNFGHISYEYYKSKSNDLFFPEIPSETSTQIISKNYPFKINISNPNNYYEIESNSSIYLLIKLINQSKEEFLVSTKNYFLINNFTTLPSKQINIINSKSENNELIHSFLHNKDLDNPYIYIQIYPCNESLTSNNYLFQDNNGNKLSNFISSETFIKYYINSYQDIHLLIQNKENIESFLLWYDYKKSIDYIKYPKKKISILSNNKDLQIEFNSINLKIEYIYNIYYTEYPLYNKCPLIINEQTPLVSFKKRGEKWIKYTIKDFNYSKGYINVEGVKMDKSFTFFYETKNIEEIGEVYSKNEKNDFYDNYFLGSYSFLIFEIIIALLLIIILLILCSYMIYKKCIKMKKKGYEIPKSHDSMELSELKQNKT